MLQDIGEKIDVHAVDRERMLHAIATVFEFDATRHEITL
jgi:hypothetical protein